MRSPPKKPEKKTGAIGPYKRGICNPAFFGKNNEGSEATSKPQILIAFLSFKSIQVVVSYFFGKSSGSQFPRFDSIAERGMNHVFLQKTLFTRFREGFSVIGFRSRSYLVEVLKRWDPFIKVFLGSFWTKSHIHSTASIFFRHPFSGEKCYWEADIRCGGFTGIVKFISCFLGWRQGRTSKAKPFAGTNLMITRAGFLLGVHGQSSTSKNHCRGKVGWAARIIAKVSPLAKNFMSH